MKEAMTPILLNEKAALQVICHTCPKLLYDPEADDFTTREIARLTADGHSHAFSEPHDVSVFRGSANVEIYRTKAAPLPEEKQLLGVVSVQE